MADLSPIREYRERQTPKLTMESFGEIVGATRGTICKWEKKRVPAERVLDVEEKTGIPRHALRPDIYPAPETAEAGRC